MEPNINSSWKVGVTSHLSLDGFSKPIELNETVDKTQQIFSQTIENKESIFENHENIFPIDRSLLKPTEQTIKFKISIFDFAKHILGSFTKSILTSLATGTINIINIASDKIRSLTNKEKNGINIKQIPNKTIPLTSIHKMADKEAALLIKKGQIKEAFECRSKAAEKTMLPDNHPLQNLTEAINMGQTNQTISSFGHQLSQMDTNIVKGGNITAYHRNIDGVEKNCFHFKMVRSMRSDIGSNIDIHIGRHLSDFEASLPSLLKGHRVTISQGDDSIPAKSEEDGTFSTANGFKIEYGATHIEFEGIGKVIIGNNSSIGCLYNDVKIEVNPDVSIQTVQQMLTVLGLGPVFHSQREEDASRIKIFQLFRAYFPAQATKIEKNSQNYDLPLSDLRKLMEKEAPEMKEIFKYYDSHPELIDEVEIYPGKTTVEIKDISEKMRAEGAFGLMSGVGSAQSVVNMLQAGAISSQDRYLAGIMVKGGTTEQDLKTGGGDHVFTRLINEGTKDQLSVMMYAGSFQILYDLDVVNRGGYAYHDDSFGIRNPDYNEDNISYTSYQERSNLMDFAKVSDNPNNEVMIKNRIPPNYIRGVLCENEEKKNALVKELEAAGLIETADDGTKKIFGKNVEEFIYIGRNFEKTMWDKP